MQSHGDAVLNPPFPLPSVIYHNNDNSSMVLGLIKSLVTRLLKHSLVGTIEVYRADIVVAVTKAIETIWGT